MERGRRNRNKNVTRKSCEALFLILFLPVLGGMCSANGSPRQPNIILVLADDLGWGDLSCYQPDQAPTPNLDGLASEGVRFTDFYSASPVCSPSRAALLTGRYPFRSGITRVLFPQAPNGLPSDEVTLAEELKAAGYATGIIGKWHLGNQTKSLPVQQGFSTFFGIPYSHDMKPLVYMRGNDVISDDTPIPALLTRRYTSESIAFIEANRDRPFFLFLSHSMPHYPVDASLNWKGRNLNNVYRDAVQELDWSIGSLLETIQQLRLTRETAVFFTSDNGSWKPSGNGPLRGRKSSTWEGGMRVPLIATYPARFRKGAVSSLPSMNFDLYTTILDMLQIPHSSSHPLDGRSLLPELTAAADPGIYPVRKPTDPLFYMHRRKVSAVRAGRWKLHLMRGNWRSRFIKIPPELYDLSQDIEERHDLSSSHPREVERLLTLASAFRMEVTEARLQSQ